MCVSQYVIVCSVWWKKNVAINGFAHTMRLRPFNINKSNLKKIYDVKYRPKAETSRLAPTSAR